MFTEAGGLGSMSVNKPNIVERFADGRLYQSETLQYLSLYDVLSVKLEGSDILIIDAISGEDVTQAVLAEAAASGGVEGESFTITLPQPRVSPEEEGVAAPTTKHASSTQDFVQEPKTAVSLWPDWCKMPEIFRK